MTPVQLRNWVFHDVLEVNPVAVELDGQPNYPANGLRSNGQTACKLATCPSSRTLRLLAQGGRGEWRPLQDAVGARGGRHTVNGHNGAKSVNGSRGTGR